jgi:F-box/leucine-rich repeat protein 5
LSVTDFANNDAFFALLSNLQSVFKEFKSHENIENEHIMDKLKTKLKAMAVYNSAVCNCHKDDEFTPLFDLVETGYLCINKDKPTSERISFGVRLRKALAHFTTRFVPHMKEEEEVFQPLLQEYFTQQELADLKLLVIKLHMQQRKKSDLNSQQNHAKRRESQELGGESQSDHQSINQLPDEILLKIFSKLSFGDKFKSAKACKRWNHLIYDKTCWTQLAFTTDWQAKNSSSSNNNSQITPNRSKFNLGYKDIEYIDESDEEEFDVDSSSAHARHMQAKDIRTFQFWVKYLLPKVGASILSLDLSSCKSLNNNLTRRILQLCPNLMRLDLSFTNIGDNTFRGVRLDKLEYLSCEGCEKLSDNAFRYILMAFSMIDSNSTMNESSSNAKCFGKPGKSHVEPSHKTSKNAKPNEINNLIKARINDECNVCANKSKLNSIEDIIPTESDTHTCNYDNEENQMSLKSINLSGCWSITDYGLSYIASRYNLQNLQYLNLSGCINMTSLGLHLFTEMSQLLDGENLYYCDNVTDGPLNATANGCSNLESANKFCCRSGQ